jgi:hypothetical protein
MTPPWAATPAAIPHYKTNPIPASARTPTPWHDGTIRPPRWLTITMWGPR